MRRDLYGGADANVAARVLIAHESATIREAVRRLVEDGGYRVVSAADGVAALDHLGTLRPEVLVVDVALPKVAAYQLCEEIRERHLPTKVILIASVYQRTAYKRRPTSLYGADDYIEQHHLPDALLGKIGKLLPRAPAPRVGPPDPAEGVAIRQAGEGRLKLRYDSLDEGAERARRMAILIVADVVLYNGDSLRDWRAGLELPGVVQRDLDEARQLFEARVPEQVRAGRDLLGEALLELLGQRDEPHSGEPHGSYGP